MPRIRITKTMPIAEDGIHVRKYTAGWEGEVSDAAAKILIGINAAVAVVVMTRRTIPTPEVTPVMLPTEGTAIITPTEKKGDVSDSSSCVIRVWELAREIGTSSSRILQVAKNLGLQATLPMSGLSAGDVELIRAALEK